MLTNEFFISCGRLDNFNEILKKDVTCDNINSKKTGFYPLFRRYFFKKPHGVVEGSKLIPLPSRFRVKKYSVF